MVANNFNLSYNSHLLGKGELTIMNKLYDLKIRSRRRSELSRYLFTEAILDQLLEIYHIVFEAYDHFLIKNNDNHSKQVIPTAYESLILLFL